MRALVYSRESLVWLVLMTITLCSWLLAWSHGQLLPNVRIEAVVIIALAFIKARLVLMHFMETAHAPLQLRLPCEAWILLSGSVLIVLESGLFTAA
ncbi:cytochrome C oxidase subunit IV family protein [Pseudomonas migulae]|uniref:Cytochrome C oxidase subunit IV n=1 Tax=Pseudomonas migulae TaxID=78543 RepID=A0A1H5IKQ8_9PSED|nr:cytochrome C oxidase subunit IV family protein [Pseudomonas migulae]SEE40451.1 Cytochrome C oxidase subunit IV [Pseudomonas migulae]